MKTTQLLLDAKYRLEKIVHPLRSVTLEVTRRCNLRCLHCYADAGPDGEEMTLDQIEQFATDLTRLGTPGVCLTGGEPMMRRDILEVLDCLRHKGLAVTMASNGTLFTPNIAKQVARRVAAISVSLDGLATAHDHLRGPVAFEAAVAGIRNLQAAGVPFLAVKTSVHRRALVDIPDMHGYVKGFGAKRWHVFAIEPRGRATPELLLTQAEHDGLRAQLTSLAMSDPLPIMFGEQTLQPRKGPCSYCATRCAAGITQLAVLSNGAVTSCIGADRTVTEGNVLREGIASIWERGFQKNREPTYQNCGGHYYS